MAEKANYPLFLLQNDENKSRGGAFSHVYVVAAETRTRAKAFAAERSGFSGWTGGWTTCQCIGTSDGREERVSYPTDRMRDSEGVR